MIFNFFNFRFISGNKLTTLKNETFEHLHRVQALYVFLQMQFSFAMRYLINVTLKYFRNLNENFLIDFEDGTFNPLSNLTSL